MKLLMVLNIKYMLKCFVLLGPYNQDLFVLEQILQLNSGQAIIQGWFAP